MFYYLNVLKMSNKFDIITIGIFYSRWFKYKIWGTCVMGVNDMKTSIKATKKDRIGMSSAPSINMELYKDSLETAEKYRIDMETGDLDNGVKNLASAFYHASVGDLDNLESHMLLSLDPFTYETQLNVIDSVRIGAFQNMPELSNFMHDHYSNILDYLDNYREGIEAKVIQGEKLSA